MMSNINEKVLRSILDIDNGAIKERSDYELEKIMQNLQDMNTDFKAKRKITVEITFTTDESRKTVAVSHVVKSKLSPTKAKEITLFNSNEIDRESGVVIPVLKEYSEVPAGQINLDGEFKTQEVFVIGQQYKEHMEIKRLQALNGIKNGQIAEGGNENE